MADNINNAGKKGNFLMWFLLYFLFIMIVILYVYWYNFDLTF